MDKDRWLKRQQKGILRRRKRGEEYGRPRRLLIPMSERRAVIQLWEANGKPAGFSGLAIMLGGISYRNADLLYRAYRRFGDQWAGTNLR